MNTPAPMLSYQACRACGHRWYFTRTFCPACGGRDVASHACEGVGILYTCTLVHRAPTEEFRALVPFSIVLVDMQEGFRVMGHADPSLPIGAAVRCHMREIAGQLLPFFKKDSSVP